MAQGFITDFIDLKAVESQVAATVAMMQGLTKEIDKVESEIRKVGISSTQIKGVEEMSVAMGNLDKEVNEGIKLRLQQTKLDNQLNELSKKYSQQIAENEKLEIAYKQAKVETNRATQNAVKSMTAEQGSIKQMRADLSLLTQQYVSLSKEERNNAQGKDMLKKIADLSAGLKDAEGEMGNFTRNVGDYKGALQGALIPQNGLIGNLAKIVSVSGGVGKAFKIIGAAMKALATNPFIVVATVLIGIFKGIATAIKSNEERFNKLKLAMAPLEAAFQIIINLCGKLADGLMVVIEWAGKAATAILNFFGKSTEESEKSANKFVENEKRKQDIIKQERKLLTDSAREEAKISELRAKAQDKETYSNKQRLSFLNEAINRETAISKRRAELAREKAEQIKFENSLSDSNTEALDREAEAEAAAIAAESAHFSKVKELDAQRQGLLREIENNRVKNAQNEIKTDIELLKSKEQSYEVQKKIIEKEFELETTLSKYDENAAEVRVQAQRKRDNALEKLGMEHIQKMLNIQNEYEKIYLANQIEGSQQWLSSQEKILENERTIAINEAKKTGADVALINAQYDQRLLELRQSAAAKVIALNEEMLIKRNAASDIAFEAEKNNILKSGNYTQKAYEEVERMEIEHYQRRLQEQIDFYKKQLENANIDAEAKKAIGDKLLQAEQGLQASITKVQGDENKKKVENFKAYAGMVTDAGLQLYSLLNAQREADFKKEQKVIDKQRKQNEKTFEKRQEQLDNSAMSEERRAAEQKKLDEEKAKADEELAQKEADLQRRQAEYEQRQAVTSAIINGAISVTKTFAQYGFTPIGIAAAAAQAIQTGIEVGIIKASEIPAYAEGGENVQGLGLWGEIRPEVAVNKDTGKTMIAFKPTITEFEPHTTIYSSIGEYMREMGENSKKSSDFDFEKLEMMLDRYRAENKVTNILDSRGLWNVINSQGSRSEYINRRLKF